MTFETQTSLLKRRLTELDWDYPRFQSELQLLGLTVTTQAIQKWVTGGGGISDRAKVYICRALSIDLGYLVRASVSQKNGGSLPPFPKPAARPAA